MRATRRAALAAAAAALGTVAAAEAPATPRAARLGVESERPVVVLGDRFHAGEWVTVTLSLERTWSRRVQADRMGRLRARFTARVPRCVRYTLRAWGSRGSRALLHVRLTPDCVPDR